MARDDQGAAAHADDVRVEARGNVRGNVRGEARDNARAATKVHKATTEGLFTTRKLQALLDARVNPDICKRTDLAKAIAEREDHPLTVHAIDAWFKRNDPNLPVLKRTSLDPDKDSFAVPRNHWSALLTIFAIEVDDLATNDETFRSWCFRTARARHRRPPANKQLKARLFICGSPATRAAMQLDAASVRALGYQVTLAASDGNGAEWSALHGLDECDALLAIVDSDSSNGYPEALAFARAKSISMVIAKANGSRHIDARFADCNVILRDEHRLSDYRATLTEALTDLLGRARPARPAQAPSWPNVQLISDRPSIAVLPFANLTGDAANNLLSDSIVEDLVSMLSRIPEFFVISRMTTQAYMQAAPDPRQVARSLGVRYVLIGSIRSSGNVLRITAQLVNAVLNTPVWNGRFDRVFDDPFAVQDEIVFEICAALEPQVRMDDIRDVSRGGASGSNVASWRLWQEGWYYLFVDAPTPVPQRSYDLFQKAIDLDPNYARAHAGMAVALGTGMLWGGLTPSNVTKAINHAELAYKLSPENPLSLYAMGMISFIQPVKIETALEYVARAVALEPSNAMYQAICGYLYATLGETARGVAQCEFAMRLSPKDSREPFLCYMLGNAYLCDRQYERAIETMTRCRRFSVVDFIWIMIAFSHAQLGEPERAIACLQSIDAPRPKRLYEWSVYERMWLTTPRDEKTRFIALFERAGIS